MYLYLLVCTYTIYSIKAQFFKSPVSTPTISRMYLRDQDGYFNHHQSAIHHHHHHRHHRTAPTPALILLSSSVTDYLLPFFNKHFIYPFFSGFFAVFSDYLRSKLFRFRRIK